MNINFRDPPVEIERRGRRLRIVADADELDFLKEIGRLRVGGAAIVDDLRARIGLELLTKDRSIRRRFGAGIW